MVPKVKACNLETTKNATLILVSITKEAKVSYSKFMSVSEVMTLNKSKLSGYKFITNTMRTD